MFARFCKSMVLSVVAVAVLVVGLGADTAVAAEFAVAGSAPNMTEPVDLNSATVEELTSLPGIGKIMAERIVAFRNEHGPFTRVEDLLKIKGIGEKSFGKLRDRVKVSDDR